MSADQVRTPSTLMCVSLALSVVLVFGTPCSSNDLSASSQANAALRLSGYCVQALISVREQMKRDRAFRPIPHYHFEVTEQPQSFEITALPDDPHVRGGGVTYNCDKTSGKILKSQYLP